ncbi:MAG: PQQ-dependent sugar dehydrogenase [Roseiflexaceae bacterium]
MHQRLVLLGLLLISLLVLPAQPTQAALNVSDLLLENDLVTGLTEPTALAFSPDESLMLIAQRGGVIRLADVASTGAINLRTTEVMTLANRTCANSQERGVLGITIDPNFATNRAFYVYYTASSDRDPENPNSDKAGNTACPTSSNTRISSTHPSNWVSRFTLAANGTADLASERVLVSNMPSTAGNHNAGDIQFGKDGYLYIAVGDGGCDYNGDTGCQNSNNASRDPNVLLGKVLRIIANPDLSPAQRVPASNPFASTSTLTCADPNAPYPPTPATQPIEANEHCRETFVYGLRNPFRMAFNPNSSATEFYINDVGGGIWEEVNRAVSGGDYRWNGCEGRYNTGSRSNLCPAPTNNQQNPIFAYDHNIGCSSITDGAVVPNGVWPSSYTGSYLFTDYTCGRIFQIDLANPTSSTTIATGMGAIVDMQFGPGSNETRALYLVDIGGGSIARIRPTSVDNIAPVAQISASPQYGSRDVTFDGSESSDPNGDTLSYEWDFGNGVTRTTTTASTSYTYPTNGTYTASLVVEDERGARSNPATIVIDTDNTPPEVTLSSPTENDTFAVGDTITLMASANDLQDGSIPASGMSWQVLLHHRAGQIGAHTHPFFGPSTGNDLTFTAPPPEDLDAASNSYLEVILTVTDSEGAQTVVRRDLLPRTTTITIATDPAGLSVVVNGTVISDTASFISWHGYQLTLEALPQQTSAGNWVALSSWDGGITTTTRIAITPTTPRTYTATFGRNAKLIFFPLIRRGE